MKKNVVKMTVVLFAVAVLAVSCASSGGAKTEQAEPAVLYSWDFSDPASGTAGWVMIPDDYWDFHGTAEVSRDDKTFGRGMLRWDVDYSKDVKSEWSEPKMKMTFNTPIEGVRKISFDFIYNPSLSKGGHFKSKAVIFNGKKQLAERNTEAILALDELPGGFLKGNVSISVRGSSPVDSIVLSIAGYKTDYKGPLFFDNIRLE
ncbi:MAG: hypothetical protein LBC52_00815 [Treponema sp.]|jgi:hypothetical protein|nr:hypothetical protein [Treponema sp.]